MKRLVLLARLLVVLLPLLALLPMGRLLLDWVRLTRVVPETAAHLPGRSYDWVVWEESEGVIQAAYVFPRGPGADAGLQAGDVFYMLEYQQFFNEEDLKRAVEGIPPGAVRTYSVLREGQFLDVTVRLTRYPTFLYPLSSVLWQASVWGFTVAAFMHLLALAIVTPLARRGRRARFSLLLIFIASLWIVSNLLRLMLVQVLGPPPAYTTYDYIFQALTGIGLVGWIGFPALLVHHVLRDSGLLHRDHVGRLSVALYVTPMVLGLSALLATGGAALGPVTLDGLIAPILFYACCYIAAAAALVLAVYLLRADEASRLLEGWSPLGSTLTFVLAALAALSVLGIVPILGAVTDTVAGWLVVGAQLLSTAPVALVSVASIRHGKVNQVLSRGLTYLTVLALIFLAFVGGMSVIEPYLRRTGGSVTFVGGLYVVVLLVVFERLARALRVYATQFLASDRRLGRQQLSHFQEHMRDIMDLEQLTREAVQVVGEAFGARSARLYLQPKGPEGAWLTGAYHPEPPYLTERIVALIWPHMQREARTWTANPELNESTLPDELSRLLQERGVAVAVPILGEHAPMGLLVLGAKQHRRAVYNLEDLDQLRSLSGQLALAVERLNLVEREKALVRQSAEAELVALRAQINPHFLFNALNTIVALIEERPSEAEQTVEHLAALFRHILQTSSRPFVTLEEEHALVRHYLAIEQTRFGEKLRVEEHFDGALAQQPVPAFALQTLVENAVKHGLEKSRDGGLLYLAATAHEGFAVLTVHDTGMGIPALFGQPPGPVRPPAFFGIGLANVAARLEQLYGRGDLLHAASVPGEGTTVTLFLPLTPEAAGPLPVLPPLSFPSAHAARPHRG